MTPTHREGEEINAEQSCQPLVASSPWDDFGNRALTAIAVACCVVASLAGPVVAPMSAQEKTLEEGVEGWIEGEESASDMGDLAKSSQNPVGSLISLPLQNNTNFGFGPGDDVQNILNIQPVIPVSLSKKWNLINRAIIPVIYQPEVLTGQGSTTGLGDTSYTGFISPKAPGKLIWGAGPVISIPTSTDDALGSGEWAAGPSVVLLTMPGSWVVGRGRSGLEYLVLRQRRRGQLLLQPDLRQLQHEEGLVPHYPARLHRQLGGGWWDLMDGTDRRWNR